MTYHDWDTRFDEGARGAAHLDKFLRSAGYKIRVATQQEEARGIDRFFTKSSGEKFSVDYKTDSRAFTTKNAFIETISVDRPPPKLALGWAIKSLADYIYYYVPPLNEVCIVKTAEIRLQLPKWLASYSIKAAPNKGYKTLGVVVPYDIFRAQGRTISVPSMGS